MPTVRTLLLIALLPWIIACEDDPLNRSEADMSFVLADRCNDGRGLQGRIFDVTNNLVWPSNSEVFFTESGGDIVADVRCSSGALICYGASTDPESALFWGVGLDGADNCTDCCEVCRDVAVAFDLSC